MRGMLIVAASLVLGVMAFAFTASDAAAQVAPAPPQKKPVPPTKQVKVVYRSQHEQEKRFTSKTQADDLAARLRAEGFNVKVEKHHHNNTDEYEVEYRLRQERTKVFTGIQATFNANAFVSLMRGLHVDAKVVSK